MAYPALFSERSCGQTLLRTLAFANAFSAPDVPAEQLCVTNRASLWNFAADFLFDTRVANRAEAAELAQRCLSAANGAPPGCDASRFLADIRGDLSAGKGFDCLGERWCEELRRMLDAMVREREWIAAPPTVEDYLPTAAASIGFSFVLLSHWIVTGDDFRYADEVIAAAHHVELVLRVINDLGTYQRDLSDGDLNALCLGVTRADLTTRLENLLAGLDLDSVRRTHPGLAVFMDRQVGFNLGFYRMSDYRAAG
jgi:hypothetical protein